MKNNSPFILFTSILTNILAIGAGIFILLFYKIPSQQSATTTPVTATLSSSSDPVVTTVKMANPAVVSITVTEDIAHLQKHYYRYIPFETLVMPNTSNQHIETGSGSGFLISPQGYILTNKHVVESENATYIVTTFDNSEHKASVVYRDSSLDIAILKIEGSNFPHLTFGDSTKLEVGEQVIAIGNSLGEFSNTVSVGVVSGLGRKLVARDQTGGREELLEAVQTDAAINLGNSGGPLLNLKGEVVGVNVAIASGAENIGFALPSHIVQSRIGSVLPI